MSDMKSLKWYSNDSHNHAFTHDFLKTLKCCVYFYFNILSLYFPQLMLVLSQIVHKIV
jgi:hypothetical protein